MPTIFNKVTKGELFRPLREQQRWRQEKERAAPSSSQPLKASLALDTFNTYISWSETVLISFPGHSQTGYHFGCFETFLEILTWLFLEIDKKALCQIDIHSRSTSKSKVKPSVFLHSDFIQCTHHHSVSSSYIITTLYLPFYGHGGLNHTHFCWKSQLGISVQLVSRGRTSLFEIC